jgi:hypothetical protein
MFGSADILVCGFMGHSCPVFQELASGKSPEPAGWKACSTTKKPPDPGKTENEGIQRILAKTVRQAGLILLFDGEVG